MSLLKKKFSRGKGSEVSKTDSPKRTPSQPPAPEFFFQDFKTSYHGWMMFPVESIAKMSAGFADVKSLYKLAKRVYLTQMKIVQIPGADKCVVRAEERFVVVRPKKLKLERPVMAAQMDTVIGMMVLREQHACVIMTYAENTDKKASVGADVLVFDKDMDGFIQAFNKCLSLRNKLPVRRRAISEDLEDDVASMVIDVGDDTSYLEMNHQHRPASRGSVDSEMSFATGGYINIQLDGDDTDDPEPGYLTVLTSGQRNDGLGYLICST
eukprot:m.179851 g.179851  ORF g.179851 m.179851 type:complete len:267 (-) comp31989_c6_seq1:277-1077(-)